MLKIRAEQLAVFDALANDAFERKAMELLREHWPEESGLLGEQKLRERITAGRQRVGEYGITADRDVLRFLNVTFALGPEFDRDPRYPWAAVYLNEPTFPPSRKMDRLTDRARRVLAEDGA